MDDEHRQREDRPRVASFLIDDILAPQAAPAVVQGPNQTPQAMELRHPSTGARDHGSLLCNQPLTSTCLPCYESHCHVSRHPCYWNAPYTCFTAAHGYSCHGNASLLAASDLFTHCGNTHPSPSPSSQSFHGQSRPRRPRRPWTRAVFSNLQRKGLEKRFQVQKYLTKADRHQLASMLGLSDNQVKVWFQNRRMKWRQEARESVTSTNNGPEDEMES